MSGLRVRWSGHQLHADAVVDVDPALSVLEGHQVVHRAEANLTRAVPKVAAVVIHRHPAKTAQ